jgi:hypothetical protein
MKPSSEYCRHTGARAATRGGLRSARAFAVVALVAGAVIAGHAALAQDERAPDARLAALDADTAHKTLTEEPRQRARAAIERSKRFRAAGDETHAKLSDRAASAWLAAAEDIARTADSEAKAEDARRAALDAGAQAERERALLEETMLQNGRLRAELDEAEHQTKPPQTSAAATSASSATPPTGKPKVPAAPPLPGKPRAKDGGAP